MGITTIITDSGILMFVSPKINLPLVDVLAPCILLNSQTHTHTRAQDEEKHLCHRRAPFAWASERVKGNARHQKPVKKSSVSQTRAFIFHSFRTRVSEARWQVFPNGPSHFRRFVIVYRPMHGRHGRASQDEKYVIFSLSDLRAHSEASFKRSMRSNGAYHVHVLPFPRTIIANFNDALLSSVDG